MAKSLNKSQRSQISKYIVGFVVLTSLVILLVVKTFLPKPIINPLVGYHGPNPITMRKALESEIVLGRSTYNRRNSIKITPTVQPPTPTPKPPTPTPVPPTPVKSQLSGNFGIAAGGNLIYLSQNDLDTYFTNLQTLGMKWVRWDIEWGAVQEYGQASYDWSRIDRVSQIALKYGINTLGTIAYAPKWARDSSCQDKFTCPPADPKAFGIFAGLAALRYKDTIHYWEIWNEPNILGFWATKPSVIKYAELLKEAYTQIKTNSPQSIIITAGLAPSDDESDGNISPTTFISSLYSQGMKDYFDAIGTHPYSYPVSPNYSAPWNGWDQMNVIRQAMIKNGDTNKKVWITEFGASTGGDGIARNVDELSFNYGHDYMTENAQSQMLIDASKLYSEDKSWMGPFFWYSLHDNGTSTDTPENFFGLMRYDWSKKPAYDVFYSLIHQ